MELKSGVRIQILFLKHFPLKIQGLNLKKLTNLRLLLQISLKFSSHQEIPKLSQDIYHPVELDENEIFSTFSSSLHPL